jgi:hypothetical protein
MIKEKLKLCFDDNHIALTIMAILFGGAFLYQLLTSLTLGGIMSTLLALYVGYGWGFVKGQAKQKEDNQ